MDDGWARSRAQGGRVRAHLPGEGPPSTPPANVVLVPVCKCQIQPNYEWGAGGGAGVRAGLEVKEATA